MLVASFGNIVGLFTGDAFQFQQMFEVTFAYRFTLLDRAIHQWLREERLISLVMPKTPVTPHIDNDVAFESTAKIHRKAHHLRNGFRIFAIDVENRNLEHFRYIAGVCARFRLRG